MGLLVEDPIVREPVVTRRRRRSEESDPGEQAVFTARLAAPADPVKFEYVVYGRDYTTGKTTRMRLRAPDGFGVIAWCYKRRMRPLRFSRVA